MRRPSPAILGSIALHAGVVALAFVSFSHKADEPKPLVNSVPVTIVSETVIEAAAADNPQPEPSPDDAAPDPDPAAAHAAPSVAADAREGATDPAATDPADAGPARAETQ